MSPPSMPAHEPAIDFNGPLPMYLVFEPGNLLGAGVLPSRHQIENVARMWASELDDTRLPVSLVSPSILPMEIVSVLTRVAGTCK